MKKKPRFTFEQQIDLMLGGLFLALVAVGYWIGAW